MTQNRRRSHCKVLQKCLNRTHFEKEEESPRWENLYLCYQLHFPERLHSHSTSWDAHEYITLPENQRLSVELRTQTLPSNAFSADHLLQSHTYWGKYVIWINLAYILFCFDMHEYMAMFPLGMAWSNPSPSLSSEPQHLEYSNSNIPNTPLGVRAEWGSTVILEVAL